MPKKIPYNKRCRLYIEGSGVSRPATKASLRRLVKIARKGDKQAAITIRCKKQPGVEYTPGAPTSIRLVYCVPRHNPPYVTRCKVYRDARFVIRAMPKGK